MVNDKKDSGSFEDWIGNLRVSENPLRLSAVQRRILADMEKEPSALTFWSGESTLLNDPFFAPWLQNLIRASGKNEIALMNAVKERYEGSFRKH